MAAIIGIAIANPPPVSSRMSTRPASGACMAAPSIAAALAPLPVGAAAVVLGGQRALALLVVGHGSLWLYEHRVLGNALPPSYLALRRQVALATCMLLALTMFVSDTAGLS